MSQRSARPEFASNLNGRQHLLLELHKIEQEFDKDTWTRMTRDLFHNLDRPFFDVKASFFTFLIANRKALSTNCARLALPIIAVLRQLAQEMRLAVDLLEFWDWDDGILHDALEGFAIQFTTSWGLLQCFYTTTAVEEKTWSILAAS